MKAVIVGAGIGGLASAIGLARDGWQVTVQERWDEIPLIGTGIGLWPAAQQGLAALGLQEVTCREAIEFGDVAIYSPNGRLLVPVPRDRIEKRTGIPVRILPRSTLLAALLARGNEVGVQVQTGVDADLAAIDADLIVAADGVRSRVRAAAFTKAGGIRYAGTVAVRGEAPGEHGPYGETWGPGVYVGITRVRPGFTNWYAAVSAPPEARPTREQLLDLVGDWHAPIPEVITATPEASILRHPVYDLHPALPTFVRGNVALVGDAAHAMTPNLGRGACEAVLDAVALVDAVRAAGPFSPAAIARALASYDRNRRRPAQRIAARSWRFGRIAHGGRFARLRDASLRALSPLLASRPRPAAAVDDAGVRM